MKSPYFTSNLLIFKAMNFLSHFYFDRHEPDPHVVIGMVLPDFVKNANKNWNLNPNKESYQFETDVNEIAILNGWNRHLEVDRIFHCSTFFSEETAELKKSIMPALQYGPVKPFFLAHIALELLLDHLLVAHSNINIQHFYDQLSRVNHIALQQFLNKSGIPDINQFMKFLDSFVSSKYLLSYQKMENITYALNRICMRLWTTPFSDEQLELLTSGLLIYKSRIELSYMDIFKEIEIKLLSPEGTC